jgi:3-oxoacyl-[acyl-carrier protein] reductase
VVVNDVDRGRAAEVVAEIQATGGSAEAAVFDVTDFVAVTAGVAALPGVDVLVSNAGNAGAEGFGNLGPFSASDPSSWEPFLRVNLYGALHCARAVLPGMVEAGWGRLITIVSDAGRVGGAQMAAYSAAKAGAAGLTRALALENGRHGITANNISLGTMRTPLTEAIWSNPDNDTARALMQDYVVRRPGVPDDAAAMAVFLASEHASWITGQTYPVNGGYSFAL